MFKFVHKNKRLIGVVMGVILMIMFLSQLAPQQSSQPNAMLKTVATVNGQKVTLRDINEAAQKWQILKTRYYYEPNSPTSQPQQLLRVLLGEDFMTQIDNAQKG